MSEPRIAIVILNYNGKLYLEKFLPEVFKHSSSNEIYVADNGSADDSISFLRTHFPLVKVIDNKINYGYAQGYNVALKDIEADYFVLLNNDVEVTANWISPIIELMQNDKKIAACQ